MDGKIGLGIKKEKIGRGKLCGWGGKQHIGETSRMCTVREFAEESGAIAQEHDLVQVACIRFSNNGFELYCPIYFLYKWEREIVETSNMGSPLWFDISSIPLDQMMAGDRFWFPLLDPEFLVFSHVRYNKDFSVKGVDYTYRISKRFLKA